jgi:SnoaL-like polyketide cyclase
VEQYPENATFPVPSLESLLTGKDAIRTCLMASFAGFPDWTMDISKVLVSGNEAYVVNSVKGTHTGPFTDTDRKAVAPTNKTFVQDQLTRVVVEESGKVTMVRAYGNPSRLNRLLRSPNAAKQIGLDATPTPHTVTPPTSAKLTRFRRTSAGRSTNPFPARNSGPAPANSSSSRRHFRGRERRRGPIRARSRQEGTS